MYEVVGIFKETDSTLDNSVYLNLTYLLDKEGYVGLYYADALSENTVSNVLSDIKEIIHANYEYYFVNYESINEYGLDSMSNSLYIFAVLAALIHLLLTTIFFITRNGHMVAIQNFVVWLKINVYKIW